MVSLGLETNFCQLDIKTQDDIELIIRNGFDPERVKNNPRVVRASSLRGLLRSGV